MRPVSVPAKKQLRLTVINVKLPVLRRIIALFTGELVLAVLGTVQEVAVITREDGQDILAEAHKLKWQPYQENGTDPIPTKGPDL